jgi:LPS O-antigen subunit length determinant protein (WzzB/FepE family)
MSKEEEKKIVERIEFLSSTATEMPEWLERQIDNVEHAVSGWSAGKREAAGISAANEEILALERRLRAEEKKIQDHINENRKTTGMPLD